MKTEEPSGRDRSGTVRKERGRKKRWRTLLDVCPSCGAAEGRHCRMGRRTKAVSHLIYADAPPPVERTPHVPEDHAPPPGVPAGHEWNQRLLWDDIPPL